MPNYDIIIIGSGAGGLTLAQSLIPTGASILILERGEHLPIEKSNWDSKAVFVDKIYRAKEEWLDKHGRKFHPNTNYWVGGNTTFYGAALMRMKRQDFDRTVHYGGGISPEWPIAYDDFRPWYDKAEKMWLVHGERGIDPSDEQDDPPYPFPALVHDTSVMALKAHFESVGLTPSPLPLGVRRNDQIPREDKCIRCTTCGGYPCLLRAKSDARTCALPDIDRASNVTLLTGRKAVRINTSPDGQIATGVTVNGPDGQEHYEGKIIVCAAGAANSAALFLASANDHHPDGLANRSGQVGRNYMFHMTSAVLSITAMPFLSQFPKTLCVMDYYFGEPDGSFDYPMGQIQMLEYMTGQTLEGQVSDWIPPAIIPDVFSNAVAHRMLSFLAMSEDLPDPNNRVTLGADGQIVLSYTFGDTTAHERLVKRLEHALKNFTIHSHSLLEHRFEVDSLLPLFGTAHQCGTLRFGKDPTTSVLDTNCKTHDLDNLYVVDTSFFPSASAVNPTLTLVANAMRVGAHLRSQLSA